MSTKLINFIWGNTSDEIKIKLAPLERNQFEDTNKCIKMYVKYVRDLRLTINKQTYWITGHGTTL